MIKVVFIDAYQTCIVTGESALEKTPPPSCDTGGIMNVKNRAINLRCSTSVLDTAEEDAYSELNKTIDIPLFSIFLQAKQKVISNLLVEFGFDKAILLNDNMVFRNTFSMLGLRLDVCDMFAARKWDVFSKNISLYSDTLAALCTLRDNFRLIMCVDGSLEFEAFVMRCLGIDKYVEQLIVTDQIGGSKEKPETWARILESLGCLACDVVVVDDRAEILAAAQLAGIETVRVRRGKYAFVENSLLPTYETRSLSDAADFLVRLLGQKPFKQQTNGGEQQ